MNTENNVVFLLDVDNTLLDNDRIIADLRAYLLAQLGSENSARYWRTFESLRATQGYVMVDDKLRILAAMKSTWQQRLTTVFPRQGHYALKPDRGVAYPAADLTIENIGALIKYDLDTLLDSPRIGGEDG